MPEGLSQLIRRGGVYYNLSGASPREVLADLMDMITLPGVLSRDTVLSAILEREELMPTATGNGIALPHPRNPLVGKEEEQLVTVAFLERPVNWGALDGRPVHTAILLLSSTPRLHLGTLSRIGYLCQQPSFRALLEERAGPEELIQAITAFEKSWS